MMEMVIAGALALMLVMVWYFYRLGRANGREQGKRWSRQTLKEIRETRDLATKRLREVQTENNELRRKWEAPTGNATTPPPEDRSLLGFGIPTRADRAQMMERTIRKDSVQKKLGRHSPPPPPPSRVMTPRGVSLGLDLYPTSHHHDIDPTGIIGSQILGNLIDDAVERIQTPSYEAPSYEPPCSSSSSDYSSGPTDFGCSDTSSSSSGSGDW